MTTGIYAIINIINGNMYIGSSINIKKRWYKHKTELNANKHHSQHLQRAWNKYGERNFSFVILLECDENHLKDIEQKFIDFLKPVYNVLPAAYSPKGYKHPKEFGEQIRQRMLGKSRMSKDGRKRVSIANTGRKHTPEELEKIGLASIGRRKPYKTYDGFISPDGIIYRNIFNIKEFSLRHGLKAGDMRRLDRGHQKSHRGWKRINECSSKN